MRREYASFVESEEAVREKFNTKYRIRETSEETTVFDLIEIVQACNHQTENMIQKHRK